MSAPPRLRCSVGLAVLALSQLAACGGARYVWIDELPTPQAADEYVIAAGDVVAVRVFNQENMSTRSRVRSDGMITVPFLGDVELRGKAPASASKELAARFKEFVVSPIVTVTVEETQQASVSVLGEVAHPGLYALDASAGVLQALAVAGGFTDYASRDAIYVVRRAPPARIRFTFSSLVQGEGRAATFRVHAGDVVVVE